MGLSDDIENEVSEIFSERWTIIDGRIIPEAKDIPLNNHGTRLDCVVLYADMADSTKLVMNKKDVFAAEVYKAFLKTCCRIIRNEGGEITAFDGDRVMAVFIGDSKNSSATKAALKINYAIPNIVNRRLVAAYPTNQFAIDYSIGIDSSKLLVARTGIRGSNDLVWVGNSANLAAKLCSLRDGDNRIWITERVFDCLNKEVKYAGEKELLIWDLHTWNTYGINIYSSSWLWKF